MSAAFKIVDQKYRGAVLVLAMIFTALPCTFAMSMASKSGLSVQTAENLHNSNGARACAESGLEIMRFWLNGISIPGSTQSNQTVFRQTTEA